MVPAIGAESPTPEARTLGAAFSCPPFTCNASSNSSSSSMALSMVVAARGRLASVFKLATASRCDAISATLLFLEAAGIIDGRSNLVFDRKF